MVVISKARLIAFYERVPGARESMLVWYHRVSQGNWENLHDLKMDFNSVDYVGNDRFVFNVSGNRYRIVAMVHFSTRTLYIRFVGTHSEYDRVDVKNC